MPPNFICQCYKPQAWQFYLFFSDPVLSISVIHKAPSINVGVRSSCDQFLQKAYGTVGLFLMWNKSHGKKAYWKMKTKSEGQMAIRHNIGSLFRS